MVRHRLPVVLHRQAALRGGGPTVRRGGRRTSGRGRVPLVRALADTPVDFAGSEIDYLVGAKGACRQGRQRNLAQVTTLAAGEGLAYDMASLQHTRTLKAHQVLHLAKAYGRQEQMKERLLSAYFTEGRHIGHDTELADLAAEVGLDRQEVLDALAASTYAAAVEADLRQARAYGISGVPFYVIDETYGVSGAQAPDTFAQVLAQVDSGVEPVAG